MTLLEQDDLPRISPFMSTNANLAFWDAIQILSSRCAMKFCWFWGQALQKELAVCFLNCLWELGFTLSDDGEKRVLKIIVPKVAKFQKSYSAVQGKVARQEKKRPVVYDLLALKDLVASLGINCVHYKSFVGFKIERAFYLDKYFTVLADR